MARVTSGTTAQSCWTSISRLKLCQEKSARQTRREASSAGAKALFFPPPREQPAPRTGFPVGAKDGAGEHAEREHRRQQPKGCPILWRFSIAWRRRISAFAGYLCHINGAHACASSARRRSRPQRTGGAWSAGDRTPLASNIKRQS